MDGDGLRVVADAVEEYLLAWVLLSVAAGVAVPSLSAITRLSTPILAVMVGAVSLTLTVEQFRAVRPRSLAAVLAGHLLMPGVAYLVAVALGLDAALVVGFVVLGAVTPELVTPVMTELAGGDTALSTTVLVATGLGSVAVVPAAVAALGGPSVPTRPIVAGLLAAVVVPMGVAVAARERFPDRVGRHEELYPAVSAAMVVVIVGGVTAENAALIRANLPLLARVGAGAVVVNGVGYALGWTLAGRSGWLSATESTAATREEQVAGSLSVGMRDFAVAAALVVAAGLPAVASLPAVAFGVVEMATSAGLARLFGD